MVMAEAIPSALELVLMSLPLLVAWIILMLASEVVLLYDLRENNAETASLMKVVWFFTVFYSGLLGLAIYWFTGRKQISDDSIWRRGFRSVSHCYSGCGSGEAVGVVVAVGILSLSNIGVAVATFGFAYLFGYALTVGPLVQEGVNWKGAVSDAFYTETLSITVMEVVAVGIDIFLADGVGTFEVRFWISLIISLSLGLVAAYPVNILLIKSGVKEGMMDPRNMREG